MKENNPSRSTTYPSRVLSVILPCLLFAGGLHAQERLTITQVIDRMLQNNLTIKQNQLNVSSAEVDLQQSRADLFPSLNGNVSNNLSFGRGLDQTTFQIVNQKFFNSNSSVNSSVDLFAGFSKINQIRQNKLLLEAGNKNVDKIKNDLVLQAVTAYFQIVFNEELLKASREQLEVARQTLTREEALLDAGNKTLADVSQAKAQVANAELNVTNAQNQLTISYLTLSQLMEMRPDSANYTVVAPTINDVNMARKSYQIDDVFNSALRTFPDVKLAELRRLSSEKGVAIAKGSLWPRISMNAGLGTSYSYRFDYLQPQETFMEQIQERFNQGIGIGISIPVFNGLAAKSNVKRAKISYQNAVIEEQLIKNNLNKVVSQAVADLKAADARYISTGNTFKAESDAFFVTEQRYNVGLVNSLDYNTSRANRNRAEIDFIQAKYDLLFRSKVIDYYLGNQITF